MNNSVTKLCTCRSATERPGCVCCVCVCMCVRSLFLAPLPHQSLLFWGGQDMNVMRGSLQRNKQIQFGKKGDISRARLWLAEVTPKPKHSRQATNTHTRAHPHTCVYRTVSLNRCRCTDRSAAARTHLSISIDKQGRGHACV